ncbi:MAG: 4Fe-4S binding protein, partial [Candidatus Bathyarchaeia archaeon]
SKNDWTREELQKYSEEMTAVTVPVNVTIKGKQKILDFTAAEKILKQAKLISLGNCGCRSRLKNCDAPLDVCLTIDKEAQEQINQGNAKKVSLEQALDALKRSHEAGLVHLTFTMKGDKQPFVICSCCSCCCHALSSLVRFNIPDAVAVSEKIAVQNMEKCTNCGTCVQRCQFHARQMIDGQLMFYQEKCFGCGLCVATCPNQAISLAKRP